MEVEVLSQPSAPSLSGLPRELEEYYAARGLRPSWTHYSNDNLSVYVGMGVRPVRLQDIEDKALREQLAQSHLEVENGYLRRMDCVLVVEPIASWEARMARDEKRRQRKEGARAISEELDERLTKLLRSTGHHHRDSALDPSSVMPGARRGVQVSKKLEPYKGPIRLDE